MGLEGRDGIGSEGRNGRGKERRGGKGWERRVPRVTPLKILDPPLPSPLLMILIQQENFFQS